MAYLLFAFVLVKDLFSEKMQKVVGIATQLYGVFSSSLIAVSLFSNIYFYDIVGVWTVGAVAFAVILIVLAMLSVKQASVKQRVSLIFVIIGLFVFLADIAAVYFGLWRTGLASKIFFLIVFLISVFVYLLQKTSAFCSFLSVYIDIDKNIR